MKIVTLIKNKKIITIIITGFFIINLFMGFNVSNESVFANAMDNETEITESFVSEDRYASYDLKHIDKNIANETIEINHLEISDSSNIAFETVSGADSIISNDTGFIEYKFNVVESARYIITIEYYPLDGKNSTIEREILINGKFPFNELRSIDFTRKYRYTDDSIKLDDNDNEYFSGMEEVFTWTSYSVSDSLGFYNNPFLIYLEEGEHTLKINSLKESMAIRSIRFEPPSRTISYNDYLDKANKILTTEIGDVLYTTEAQNPYLVSDTILYPGFDRSSPDTTPVSSSKIKLNMISGTQWQHSGQWIEWVTDVETEGLYMISLRIRQNFNDGMFTSRKLMINGEVPFQEAQNVTFQYDSSWQTITLGNEKPYLFHLKKGENKIRLQNTLGEMSEILMEVDEIVKSLNSAYIEIMKITGPTPDQLRDYNLNRLIPETIEDLVTQAKRIEEVIDVVRNTSGIKGSYLAPLERVLRHCVNMSNEPAKIPRIFGAFKNDIGSLATWLTNSQLQPLDIDKIYIHSDVRTDIYKQPNIFQRIWHQVLVFVSSFFNDLNLLSRSEDSSSIKVWLGSGAAVGRDQAMIIKRMIEDTFTPGKGIVVNLQLVAPGSLLPASLSGRGPDVALRIGATDSMNFALRGAVLDISTFPDFDEVSKRFEESAMVPLTFKGKSYGLPETHTFPVMFYRKDILENLGINRPETWNDVYSILAVLQRNNMNFAIPVTNFSTNEAFGISGNQTNGFKSYAMLLFQRGGELYLDDGKYSALDSKVQSEVFRDWTNLYTNYRLPLAYEFTNRFAMGEIPIGIADYTAYNALMVYFPEIKGLWGFDKVPGTIQSDGSINHSVPGDVVCSIIMKSSYEHDASWEFIKFLTSSSSQIRFGKEIEAMLGPGARWPSANKEAVEQTAWNTLDLENLLSQFDHVVGVPEVPGGYYTTRYLDLSFRRVVYYRDNIKDTLLTNVRTINDELATKRKEFGYDD